MYAGHFAAGLAIKGHTPAAPTWGLLLGVGLLDLLFGPFVLLGIERASITPDVSPGFSLDYIDWSHSLAMALMWSIAYAACFARYGRRVMVAMGFAVFSHFLLDLPMHPPDLALWPGSDTCIWASGSGAYSQPAGGFWNWALSVRGWRTTGIDRAWTARSAHARGPLSRRSSSSM